MKTLTYNSSSLSAKERLAIAGLIRLFESRLNAKWVAVNPGNGPSPDVVLVDADQPEGRQALAATNSQEKILPVTADDRWPHPPFVGRPIRAYGPSGLIVLFNALGQARPSSEQEGSDQRREPARFRMTGRLEANPAPVRATPPMRPSTPLPAVRPALPPSARPAPALAPVPKFVSEAVPAESPLPPRVTVRWGPPHPVILPPLVQMPGARIHRFGEAAAPREALHVELPSPVEAAAPAPAAPEATSSKMWSAPEPETHAPLVSMPVAHRPTELYRPATPVIGRARLAEQAPIVQPVTVAPSDIETPVLRTSPPQWKALEPEATPELIDFRTVPEVTFETAAAPFAETLEVEPALTGPEVADEEVAAELAEVVPDEIAGAIFSEMEGLESLSDALDAEAPEEESVTDPGADWWGTAQLEPLPTESAEGSLLSALKAIKASNQPGILEIAGLPAVCVIPARNIYFTTAPAARLETAMGTRDGVTWRLCSTEAEARQISGTEQSRQSSLEQLYWTASLLSGAADAGMADQVVRLRRWPPLTESRTRSKFVRYATLLSGAHATPRELADITGDPLEDIVCFVQACAEMNLLETPGQSEAPSAAAPTRTHGAGILRGMIEQLTPPKL